MDARVKQKRRRQGFTLVELLMVIVIIGILAGMISAAAIAARSAAKRAVIKTDISMLELALEDYKIEYGDYPPDFVGLNTDDDPLNDTAAELAAKQAINRHLRKRFPRFRGDWNTVVANLGNPPNGNPPGYGIDASRLDAASALAFWLGGLPETVGSEAPAGFHTDPSNPFKPGLPRTEPFFDFDPKRYAFEDSSVLQCRYVPKGIRGADPAPYVYFKSQRAPTGEQTFFYMQSIPLSNPPEYAVGIRSWPPVIGPPTGPQDRAVAYQDDNSVLWNNEARWESGGSYQIISAGLDGSYGTRATTLAALQVVLASDLLPPIPPSDRSSDHPIFLDPSNFQSPATRTGDYFFDGDHDNLTNFADGELENQIE